MCTTIFYNVVIKWSYGIQIVTDNLQIITHNCNHTQVMHTTMKWQILMVVITIEVLLLHSARIMQTADIQK